MAELEIGEATEEERIWSARLVASERHFSTRPSGELLDYVIDGASEILMAKRLR